MSSELGYGKVIAATEQALCFDLEEIGEDEVWIPRSVIEDDDSEVKSDAEEGAEGEVFVKTWFAEKEGLV